MFGLISFSVLAAINKIDVAINNIKVTLIKDNANEIIEDDNQNILLNGTTYVPLRAIAEAFDWNIEYIDNTKEVIIRNYIH